MDIKEEVLREIVIRVLKEIEEGQKKEDRKKVYVICEAAWDSRYEAFFRWAADKPEFMVYPVVPDEWKNNGCAAKLSETGTFEVLLTHSECIPSDLDKAITVFPVVSRDTVAKTALCISDTFETKWISSCIAQGAEIRFLSSGLTRFSGREPKAYVEQILMYYRKILEYGIEICCRNSDSESVLKNEVKQKTVNVQPIADIEHKPEKKRVITAGNIEEYASGKILYRRAGDIITDLAKDRAYFLNIEIKDIE